jgi:carbon starvation protein CstA
MYFFYNGGWREIISAEAIQQFVGQTEGGKTLIQYFSAPKVVELVCEGWLGVFGGILALLGVVAAPITSGDTAFRSARLIIAEAIGVEQHSINRRLAVCIPMFAVSIALLVWQMENPDGFNTIWQYFGWSNQTLAVFTLWTITVYLAQQHKPFYVTLIPALFMTVVCSTFLLVSGQALNLDYTFAWVGGGLVLVIALVWFYAWYKSSVLK